MSSMGPLPSTYCHGVNEGAMGKSMMLSTYIKLVLICIQLSIPLTFARSNLSRTLLAINYASFHCSLDSVGSVMSCENNLR